MKDLMKRITKIDINKMYSNSDVYSINIEIDLSGLVPKQKAKKTKRMITKKGDFFSAHGC